MRATKWSAAGGTGFQVGDAKWFATRGAGSGVGRHKCELAFVTGYGTVRTDPLAADRIPMDAAGRAHVLSADRARVQAPGASNVSVIAQSQVGDDLVTGVAADRSERAIV